MSGAARRVLLVGGSSEIGLAIVRRLVDPSAQSVVTLAGRPSAWLIAAEAALDEEGLQTHVLAYDAQWDAPATSELFAEASSRMGGLDLVVVAVGSLGEQPPQQFGPSGVLDHDPCGPAEPALQSLLVANFVGPALVANAAVDLLAAQRRGTLVVISSVAAIHSRQPILGYSAAKRGLDELVLGLAVRARPFGVRCLVVRPGRVRTRMSAGSSPVPLTVDPETVAGHTHDALERNRAVAWSPPLLGPLTGALRLVPTALLPKELR